MAQQELQQGRHLTKYHVSLIFHSLVEFYVYTKIKIVAIEKSLKYSKKNMATNSECILHIIHIYGKLAEN